MENGIYFVQTDETAPVDEQHTAYIDSSDLYSIIQTSATAGLYDIPTEPFANLEQPTEQPTLNTASTSTTSESKVRNTKWNEEFQRALEVFMFLLFSSAEHFYLDAFLNF
jgi:hypothetical protein